MDIFSDHGSSVSFVGFLFLSPTLVQWAVLLGSGLGLHACLSLNASTSPVPGCQPPVCKVMASHLHPLRALPSAAHTCIHLPTGHLRLGNPEYWGILESLL